MRLALNTAQLCLNVAQVLSKGGTNLRAALKRAFSSFWTKSWHTIGQSCAVTMTTVPDRPETTGQSLTQTE